MTRIAWSQVNQGECEMALYLTVSFYSMHMRTTTMYILYIVFIVWKRAAWTLFKISPLNFRVNYLMTFSTPITDWIKGWKRKKKKRISISWHCIPSAPGEKRRGVQRPRGSPVLFPQTMQEKGGGDCEKWGWFLISDKGLMKQLGLFALKRWGWWCCWWQHVFMCVYLGSEPHPPLKHVHLVMHGRKRYCTQSTHIKKIKR